MKRILLTIALFCFAQMAGGCAFFNTFYHARKSYNNGVVSITRSYEQVHAAVTNKDVPPDRFSPESIPIPTDARNFFDVAIEKANKVIVLHPESGWVENAILLSGKAHYQRGQNNDFFDARNRFEVFLTKYPKSDYTSEAHLWYGKALYRMGQWADARRQLELAAESNGNNNITAEALLFLGDLDWESGDFASAVKLYVKASAAASDRNLRKAALYKAAYGYYSDHQAKSALFYMDQLVRMDLDFQERFDARFMQARMFKEAGEYDKAIRTLDRLLGNPKYASLFVRAEFEIGDALRLQGRNRAAEKQLLHVISTYDSPVFAGDSYYILGLMYSDPVLRELDDFEADPALALKCFQVVRTRYGSSTFYQDAKDRIERAVTLSAYFHAIHTDEVLVAATQSRLADTTSTLSDYWPQIFTLQDSADVTEEQVSAAEIKTNPLLEVYRARISSPEQEAKQKEAEEIFLYLTESTNVDSLKKKERLLREQLYTDELLLGDYFYYSLSEYDSAYTCYQHVADRGQDRFREYALYGMARVMQKKGHPDYLDYFRAALNEFPDGELAGIGRSVFGLSSDENTPDGKLKKAEAKVFIDRDYSTAEKLYLQVALEDSAQYRFQALYALGWLNETLARNETAFRYYQTIVYANPGSRLAQRVKPKCDAFVKENNIAADSLIRWVDTRFVRIKTPKKQAATPTDTTKSEKKDVEKKQEKIELGKKRRAPADEESGDLPAEGKKENIDVIDE